MLHAPENIFFWKNKQLCTKYVQEYMLIESFSWQWEKSLKLYHRSDSTGSDSSFILMKDGGDLLWSRGVQFLIHSLVIRVKLPVNTILMEASIKNSVNPKYLL